jgi:hypothetical protein
MEILEQGAFPCRWLLLPVSLVRIVDIISKITVSYILFIYYQLPHTYNRYDNIRSEIIFRCDKLNGWF